MSCAKVPCSDPKSSASIVAGYEFMTSSVYESLGCCKELFQQAKGNVRAPAQAFAEGCGSAFSDGRPVNFRYVLLPLALVGHLDRYTSRLRPDDWTLCQGHCVQQGAAGTAEVFHWCLQHCSAALDEEQCCTRSSGGSSSWPGGTPGLAEGTPMSVAYDYSPMSIDTPFVSASPLAQPSFTPAMFQERGQKAPQDPNLAADAAARDLQEQLDLSAASEQKASGVDGEAGAKPAAAAGSGADGQIPQQQPAGQQQEGAAQERQPPRHSGPTGIRVKCMTGRFQAMDLCGPMHAPTGLEAAFQAKVQLAGPAGSAGSQDRARPAKAQAGVQADGAAAPQRQPQAEARGDQAPAAAGGSLSGMSSQQQQQQQQQGAGIAQPAEGSAAAEAGNGLGSSQVPSAGAEAGVPAAAAQQSGQPTDAAGGQGGAGSSEAAASAGFPSPPVSFGAAPAPAAFQFGAVPDASTPPGNAARRASRQRHGRYAPGSTRGSHSPLGAAPSAVGSKAESRLGQAASMPMGQCEGGAGPARQAAPVQQQEQQQQAWRQQQADAAGSGAAPPVQQQPPLFGQPIARPIAAPSLFGTGQTPAFVFGQSQTQGAGPAQQPDFSSTAASGAARSSPAKRPHSAHKARSRRVPSTGKKGTSYAQAAVNKQAQRLSRRRPYAGEAPTGPEDVSSEWDFGRHFAGESSSSVDSDSSSDDLVGIGVMRSPANGSQAQQPQRQRQGAAAVGGRGGHGETWPGASPRDPRPGGRVDTSPITWQGQVYPCTCSQQAPAGSVLQSSGVPPCMKHRLLPRLMHEAAVQAAEEAPLAPHAAEPGPQQAAGAAAAAGSSQHLTEQQLQATQRADSCRNDGNAAFQRARFGAAEQDYSKGIGELEEAGVLQGETLVKLLCNRAACQLQLSKPLPALVDSQRAVRLDMGNFRSATRTASCLIKLARFDEAVVILQQFQAALPAGSRPSREWQTKMQELSDAKRLLEEARTGTSTASLLGAMQAKSEVAQAATPEAIRQAQSLVHQLVRPEGFCPFSQECIVLQASLLLKSRQFSQALKLAQEHSFPSRDRPTAQHWAWWTCAQSHFFLGELELAKQLLQQGLLKLQGERMTQGTEGGPGPNQARELIRMLDDMLDLKKAGNEAFKRQAWAEAVTRYTAAVAACDNASPAFAAVLHSNRAAAYQALQAWPEAIADCLRSKALDPSFTKAHSRLASLLLEVRCSQAAVATLESLLQALPENSRTAEQRSARKSAQQRLQEARTAARRGQKLHHYKLLGLERGCTTEEVRKAYKKSSLRFHPDKALVHCRFAASLGDSGTVMPDTSEIQARVRSEAHWLFTCIGEAQMVLSDPIKRRAFDEELFDLGPAKFGGFNGYQQTYGHYQRSSASNGRPDHRGYSSYYAGSTYSRRAWGEDDEDHCSY
eukprot:jgi/Astpho2/7206/fgenesh1_pg.00113_%23_41_t